MSAARHLAEDEEAALAAWMERPESAQLRDEARRAFLSDSAYVVDILEAANRIMVRQNAAASRARARQPQISAPEPL